MSFTFDNLSHGEAAVKHFMDENRFNTEGFFLVPKELTPNMTLDGYINACKLEPDTTTLIKSFCSPYPLDIDVKDSYNVIQSEKHPPVDLYQR